MSHKEIPLNVLARELDVHLDQISYNEMIPAIEYDAAGNELPNKPANLALGRREIYRLLRPYFTSRFSEQFKAVMPLVLVVIRSICFHFYPSRILAAGEELV